MFQKNIRQLPTQPCTEPGSAADKFVEARCLDTHDYIPFHHNYKTSAHKVAWP